MVLQLDEQKACQAEAGAAWPGSTVVVLLAASVEAEVVGLDAAVNTAVAVVTGEMSLAAGAPEESQVVEVLSGPGKERQELDLAAAADSS